MRRNNRVEYRVYKDGNLEITCDREMMIAYVNVCPRDYYKKIKKGINTFNGYVVEKVSIEEQKEEKKKVLAKKENALDVIIRILEECGNTILVKSELKYLPTLKQKYRLDVQHYEKHKNYFVYANEELNEHDDYVITWLDWGN